jgi:hypothetical protein
MDPANLGSAFENVLLSYTTAGALRSGYPIHVGNDAGTQTVGHPINAIAVNQTGSVYLVGDDPHSSVAARRSLVIQRLPTR